VDCHVSADRSVNQGRLVHLGQNGGTQGGKINSRAKAINEFVEQSSVKGLRRELPSEGAGKLPLRQIDDGRCGPADTSAVSDSERGEGPNHYEGGPFVGARAVLGADDVRCLGERLTDDRANSINIPFLGLCEQVDRDVEKGQLSKADLYPQRCLWTEPATQGVSPQFVNATQPPDLLMVNNVYIKVAATWDKEVWTCERTACRCPVRGYS